MKISAESIITLEFFGKNNLSYKLVIPYNCPLTEMNEALENFKKQAYKWEDAALEQQKKIEELNASQEQVTETPAIEVSNVSPE